ncbi:hypothetical protein OAP63_11905 [Vibrio sp.]|uniref:AraC family transcriptional regulator n=1 Tax=Vibrio viridaestus TaxID=2487322 RepID=A0A3N9U0D3_9VIBR|nr:hypothetical protein [Vibrio viridaestus]MDC0611435.1 hypothetical protein [Vibrio sp.]RQW62692.1 hypothetical protein EES38_13275 [Vibrio viridaestus]
MHYLIEVNQQKPGKLIVTGRKPSLKHSLILVQSGVVLCRLGKLEYAIQAGEAFWLPFDCLTSWTIFPNTDFIDITVSARTRTRLPNESGYVSRSEWLNQLIQKMVKTDRASNVYPSLSNVLLNSLSEIAPSLYQSAATKLISTWNPDNPIENKEINDILLAREIFKLKQSGKKPQMIADQLLNGSLTTLEKISKQYLP